MEPVTAQGLSENELLEQQLISVQAELSNAGFIACGDLKSTKRKDIKARLRCIKELLKTRRRDESYRATIND